MNVGIISLGCAKNRVDTEEVLSWFARNSFQIVSDKKDADILVINTCGFIESAKKEAIATIFDALSYKKKDPHKIVVVIGCLIERYYAELVHNEDLKDVDLMVPIKKYGEFGELLRATLIKRGYSPDSFSGEIEKDKRLYSTPSYQSYLQISDGCNNFCTFCAIPLIRGRFHSFPFEMVKKEIKEIAERGTKEITIISQDTSIYGTDLKGQNITICDVLKECLKYDSFKFIRLLYLYPDEITDEFIQLYKDNPRLTPYFDVPIQHSEDHLLKAMHRHGDKKLIENLIDKLRTVPNAVLRTTLIVGFPGETKRDIDRLIKFLNEHPFDHLGVFTYSPEEGTLGALMKHQVRESTKKERYQRVMRTQQKISYRLNKRHLGETMDVMVTGYDEKNLCYSASSYLYAPDDIDGQIYLFSSERALENGEVVKAKIVNTSSYDMDAQVINPDGE